MRFDINYYFENIEEKEIFSKVTQGKREVMEIFELGSTIIDEIQEKGKQEIYTDNIQENVKIDYDDI